MSAAHDLRPTCDFHLVVEANGNGFQVRGRSSEGVEDRDRIAWPLADEEQAAMNRALGLLSSGRQPARARAAARELGGLLFQLLFPARVLACFRTALDRLVPGAGRLRLHLRFYGAPELARLPWELLYDPQHDRYFAHLERTTLVRNLELPRRLEPLAVEPPLTMLVVTAHRAGHGIVDGDEEWRRINEALSEPVAAGRLEVERLAKPTLEELEGHLRRRPCHILHFVGHGRANHEGGALIFERRDGGERKVSGQQLSNVLFDLASCRLVVLSACHGAAASDAPFHNVAESLLRQGIPAVVAMRSWLTEAAAQRFARLFYSRIAGGLPVDQAMASARRGLDREELGCEWATPVLYLQALDGKLFAVAEPARPATGASPLPGPGAGGGEKGRPSAEALGSSGEEEEAPQSGAAAMEAVGGETPGPQAGLGEGSEETSATDWRPRPPAGPVSAGQGTGAGDAVGEDRQPRPMGLLAPATGPAGGNEATPTSAPATADGDETPDLPAPPPVHGAGEAPAASAWVAATDGSAGGAASPPDASGESGRAVAGGGPTGSSNVHHGGAGTGSAGGGASGGGDSQRPPATPRRPPGRSALLLSALALFLVVIGYCWIPDLLPPSYDRCPSPPGLDLPMVYIPPGSFVMGSREESGVEDDEKPPHKVVISEGFCMAQFELTYDLLAQLRDGEDLDEDPPGPRYPVGSLSWERAQQIVAWLNEAESEEVYSLPTEAQWEYAARAGTETTFSFGDDPADLPRYGNCLSGAPDDDGQDGAAPVGSFKPNPWGLYDMHGNVREWTADWHAPYPEAEAKVLDPTGPATGTERVLRGGGYANTPENCRAAKRWPFNPNRRHQDNGLRVVRTAAQKPPTDRDHKE